MLFMSVAARQQHTGDARIHASNSPNSERAQVHALLLSRQARALCTHGWLEKRSVSLSLHQDGKTLVTIEHVQLASRRQEPGDDRTRAVGRRTRDAQDNLSQWPDQSNTRSKLMNPSRPAKSTSCLVHLHSTSGAVEGRLNQ